MERPAHQGLGHLALNVQDVARAARFYVDLLGFAVVWAPDPDNVYLSSGRDNLALHRAPRPAAAPSGGPRAPSALDHLGLLVATPDDVDRWGAFLESHGVPLTAAPRTHRDGSRSLYVDDPDGNRIQILHLGPVPRRASDEDSAPARREPGEPR
jgi:catechol 2,3-dioxygenase-like lactoylglutathione lyase family enzyme